MTGAFPLFALLLQGLSITATAGVDRDRVAVGDEFTYTIYARTDGAGSLILITPAFDGLEVVQRSERREVGVTGARNQVWEFKLRGHTVGRFTLGPAQIVQGGVIAQAPAVDVEVLVDGTGIASQLNPRLRALLTAAIPPDSGAAVTVLFSADQVLVGQQVDVVTAAWFPRDLRLRLRRAPTVEPPEFTGVWSYPQPIPPGIAETRRVGDTWYDVFIYHSVVFPITPGPLHGTEAVLRYSVPLAFQFFSQEERFELKSAVPQLVALPLPSDGQPAGFDGAVGSDLTLTREVEGTPRAGEPVGVRFILTGRGNVALWPPPFLRWPTGLQVYPEGTDEKLDAVAGVLGGTKVFRYLMVPDSAGVLPIPTVTYHFFDPGPSTYQTTSVAGLRLPVAPPLSSAASRAEPPPLMLRPTPLAPWQVAHGLPWWGWTTVWLLLPVLFLARRLPRRSRATAEREVRLPPWLAAQHRLEQALIAILAEGATDPADLTRALREAGADSAFADRVVAVRQRLGAERFAPTGGNLPPTLLEESRAVTATLEKLAQRGRNAALKVGAIAGLLLLAIPASSQQVPAERLYETGADRAAKEAFALRAAAAPAVVANWYGLGAAAYRLGDDGVAVAAWTRAARRAPRDRSLARAMLLVPAPDPASAEWRGVLPFTNEECFLLATVLWLAAWGGVWISGRWRGRWGVVATGALCLLTLAGWGTWQTSQPLGILTASTPLRVSPHGRAPGSRDLPVGTAIHPEGKRAGWVLVRAASGEIGWVEAADLAWIKE
jgi:hypothetical protein